MLTDGWLATGSHTRCPECRSLNLFVKEILQTKDIGTFSLAGNQLKFSAKMVWIYKCADCGATGPAAEKSEEEKGTWVDGLGDDDGQSANPDHGDHSTGGRSSAATQGNPGCPQ
jgi:DNA-directed RNA polymerase subunit RPC12/RpoP